MTTIMLITVDKRERIRKECCGSAFRGLACIGMQPCDITSLAISVLWVGMMSSETVTCPRSHCSSVTELTAEFLRMTLGK